MVFVPMRPNLTPSIYSIELEFRVSNQVRRRKPTICDRGSGIDVNRG